VASLTALTQLLNALLANETAIGSDSLTLGLLVALYLESPKHEGKKGRTQRDDAAKLKRVVAFLGQDRNVEGRGSSNGPVGSGTLLRTSEHWPTARQRKSCD